MRRDQQDDRPEALVDLHPEHLRCDRDDGDAHRDLQSESSSRRNSRRERLLEREHLPALAHLRQEHLLAALSPGQEHSRFQEQGLPEDLLGHRPECSRRACHLSWRLLD